MERGLMAMIDGIKCASKPLSQLQFCFKTQETTGPKVRKACGTIDIS